MNSLKFFKISHDAILPTRGTYYSCGLDLYSNESILSLPGKVIKVKTGLGCIIPDGSYGKIEDRSSVVTRYHLKTVAGIIDSDYRGEIIICLYNLSAIESINIHKGQPIAQLILCPYLDYNPLFVNKYDKTTRDCNGFGSTSVNF